MTVSKKLSPATEMFHVNQFVVKIHINIVTKLSIDNAFNSLMSSLVVRALLKPVGKGHTAQIHSLTGDAVHLTIKQSVQYTFVESKIS